MLLVPRNKNELLSEILGALPDGFYQVPRFELPEMLWEAAFDRRDPVGNLEKLRTWSMQFHLNQVVHNFMPMRYDALGDFQAALREDMFAIHGFDEKMLLGWHCDSNLAARLALYRGTVDTLIDKVFGYHCDHTRVAAVNNKGRRTKMNDHERYIWDISSPYLPHQAESWGWPDLEIEEIRLDRDTAYERFVTGISAAMEPATEPYRTTNLEWHLFEDLSYDLLHTLPFVCDQVLTYPRNTQLMFVGARPELLRRFAVAWKAMGFVGTLLVPDECEGLPTDIPCVERGSFSDLQRRTDLFIFEFGLASQELNDPPRVGRDYNATDEYHLRAIERLFRLAASTEGETRPAGKRMARRFIGVNVIYNRYWPLFTDYIGTNINPFCGQILAGIPRVDPSIEGTALRLRGRYVPGSLQPRWLRPS